MLIERLFAAGSVLAHDMMRLRLADGILAPESWSLEAVEAFRPALYAKAPIRKTAVEENILPSWLWKHRAAGDKTQPEVNVMDAIERLAGGAAYRGWKAGLWRNEIEASAFYDEIRVLLITRRLVLAPEDCARLGLAWAYGAHGSEKQAPHAREAEPSNLILQNETIDAILSGRIPAAQTKWLRFLEASQRRDKAVIAFADTIAEWGAAAVTDEAPRAMLNLTSFCETDGSLDVAGLEQAARLGVLLLDLYYDRLGREADETRPLTLGFCNLASLLMGMGLPYDSRAARGTAAAVTALITGAATDMSAELAARLGPCKGFLASRTSLLRKLENQTRAAFGEKNDYDRLSILPQALDLDSGVNLVLLSAARHVFEKAVEKTRAHGLRHTQVTGLYRHPSLAPLAEAFSQGIEPESALSCGFATNDAEIFEHRVNPALPVALAHLGYDCADIGAVCDHVVGYRTLRAAPGVSQTALREKGFDAAALARVEAYLPQVDRLRAAFTPWVLGVAFCRDKLKVPAKELKNPGFDLLRFLGFTPKEIAVADAFCCGHGRVKGAPELAEKDGPVFATRDDIAPEALVKMAAAVQSFMAGDVKCSLVIPASITAQVRGELLLMAWKRGLRSLALVTEGEPLRLERGAPVPALIKRRTKSLRQVTGKKAALPTRKTHARAVGLTLKSRTGKAGNKEKRG